VISTARSTSAALSKASPRSATTSSTGRHAKGLDALARLERDVVASDNCNLAERYMGLARDTCDRAGLDPDALIGLSFLA